MMTITDAFLESGRTVRGGWTRAQLAAIGVPWPPPHKWKRRIVGKQITLDAAERFLRPSADYRRPPDINRQLDLEFLATAREHGFR